MHPNPLLGVLLHAIGGVAHGSFYAPLRKVRQWSWETGWLVQGLAAWILTPWIIAAITGSQPLATLQQSPSKSLGLAYLFGMMWGCGSLTFGLTMRYLGMSLGMAVALGYCASFGTLIPPLVAGSFGKLLSTGGGQMVLGGVAVCLTGIGLCGYAGIRKERELTAEQKHAVISEFSLWKGFLVATFSGIMSAGFAYGIQSGKPIADAALALGAPDLFKNAPVFIVVMGGGFTVNGIWCLLLNVKNGHWLTMFRRVRPRALPWRTAAGSLRRTICWRQRPGSSGTPASFSMAWERPKWGGTTSRAGPSTWLLSSFSVPSAGCSRWNGKALAAGPWAG